MPQALPGRTWFYVTRSDRRSDSAWVALESLTLQQRAIGAKLPLRTGYPARASPRVPGRDGSTPQKDMNMMQKRRFLKTACLAATLTVALAACGSTTMMDPNKVALSATMAGSNEVPANSTTGSGSVDAVLDKSSNTLTWKLSYTGLTGPAVAAHFHGPAAVGSNAGVVVPFTDITNGGTGSATLTAAQVTDLMAGKWYANVHTAANKGGEIRGQVLPKM